MSQRLTKRDKRKLRQDGVIDAEGRFRPTVFNVSPNIVPKTENQELAFEAHAQGYNLLLHGCAGTGKSFLGLLFGFSAVIENNSPYKKVIIIRSTVPSRDQGFQPGNKANKEGIYETPYPTICNQIFKRGDAYGILKQKNMIEFTSTSYLRSLTFDNAYVIVDECQNMTFQELDTVITRGGDNCKFIFCGDTKQTDLHKRNDQSGLNDFMSILSRMKAFKFVQFYSEDIVRSGLVKEYIQQKERVGL